MKKKIYITVLFFLTLNSIFAQNFPWNNPLRIAHSTDGITFGASAIFQDSAGVPCVIRWKGDTLAAVFQWFRQPNPSPTWDKVAIKFSYDAGLTWTQPVPLVFNGLPPGYQRPFDPTLFAFNGDSLRIYFSSSATPPMQLDSTVNTYSAKSGDGINYFFENNPRVNVANGPVIDPAVIYFNNSVHYAAPAGPPQAGAYHYVSPDGINFSPVPMIPSDAQHNWTGNYMVNANNDLRFYGSGQLIWFNSSPNGGTWNGYVNTNVQGGDPSVLRVSTNDYIMIYVGPKTATGLEEVAATDLLRIFPNPAAEFLNVEQNTGCGMKCHIVDVNGETVMDSNLSSNCSKLDICLLPAGIYCLMLDKSNYCYKFVKQK